MTLLKHYFEADEDPAVIREMAADWLDILGIYPQATIEAACRDYLRDEPRKRPTPGAVRALCLKHLEHVALVNRVALMPPVEPPRERCTPEAAARILAEAGLTPQRLSAIAQGRRMPRPGSLVHEVAMPERDEPMSDEDVTAMSRRIASRPYTDEERARMAALRAPVDPMQGWEPDLEAEARG